LDAADGDERVGVCGYGGCDGVRELADLITAEPEWDGVVALY
jgi:hypothetical protein